LLCHARPHYLVTLCTLSMMLSLAHAGSDQAYARKLVAARVMEVTSIELEVVLCHNWTYKYKKNSPADLMPSCQTRNLPWAQGAPTILWVQGAPLDLWSMSFYQGLNFFSEPLPRTENRESVRRPLADQNHEFHGEDNCTEGFINVTTDHRQE
jgi:hypothetical protein